MFALLDFPGRPTYCLCRPQVSGGERSERRLRRIKRGERVAAVDRCQGALSPKADVGYRNRMLLARKKPRPFGRGFVFALPIFPGRPTYCLCRLQVSGGHLQAKKEPDSRLTLLCSRYLSSRAVTRQVLSAYMSLTSVFGMGTGGPS